MSDCGENERRNITHHRNDINGRAQINFLLLIALSVFVLFFRFPIEDSEAATEDERAHSLKEIKGVALTVTKDIVIRFDDLAHSAVLGFNVFQTDSRDDSGAFEKIKILFRPEHK